MTCPNTEKLIYSIMDPTGNITALVESPVPAEQQPGIAERIMNEKPAVEQVGFVDFSGTIPALRMAGGEFCGNASMCAAALFALCNRMTGDIVLDVRVSGAADPVEVRLRRTDENGFDAAVKMPSALSITEIPLSVDGLNAPVPVVRMEGISHLIVSPSSAFYPIFAERPEKGEQALRLWSGQLGADGLGLMMLTPSAVPDEWKLEPLVYIPGSETLFHEHSCASGTAAAGMYLAHMADAPLSLVFHEPGGALSVNAGAEGRGTRLSGKARFLERCVL